MFDIGLLPFKASFASTIYSCKEWKGFQSREICGLQNVKMT
jgi:hypothetical protein